MKRIITYTDIYESNINLMKKLVNTQDTSYDAWIMFYKEYTDPDGYPVGEEYRSYKKIKCTADGLLSVNRIYEHEGFGTSFIESYTQYRKIPVIFFPTEMNGINMARYKIFGDRIDHTLFDLKNRLSQNENNKKNCKLVNAYNQPKTKLWLDEIKSFENYVEWLGLRGIFTNDNYEVFDLELNDGTIITTYANEYSKKWSSQYYNNIKKKIEQFYSKKHS